jgi:CRISPR-associated protein Cmr4
MRESGIMLGLFAETSLHPGTGSTTGVVDLPVQRERHTDFPIIQASGIKGAMRERAENEQNKTDSQGKLLITEEDINIIFGPKNSDHAGALALTDARVMAFPVRSLSHVYVWVTCPAVISRIRRDAAMLDNVNLTILPNLNPADGKALAFKGSGQLILEELVFDLDTSKSAEVKSCITELVKFLPSRTENDGKDIYEAVKTKMETDLVVISDIDFTHLVKNATQVSARIVLKQNKTSENLWYEESIPTDTLFYTLLMASKPRGGNSITDAKGVLDKVQQTITNYLQIGGNETVGMGWCAVRYYGG